MRADTYTQPTLQWLAMKRPAIAFVLGVVLASGGWAMAYQQASWQAERTLAAESKAAELRGAIAILQWQAPGFSDDPELAAAVLSRAKFYAKAPAKP
jgi:hypothetical protein